MYYKSITDINENDEGKMCILTNFNYWIDIGIIKDQILYTTSAPYPLDRRKDFFDENAPISYADSNAQQQKMRMTSTIVILEEEELEEFEKSERKKILFGLKLKEHNFSNTKVGDLGISKNGGIFLYLGKFKEPTSVIELYLNNDYVSKVEILNMHIYLELSSHNIAINGTNLNDWDSNELEKNIVNIKKTKTKKQFGQIIKKPFNFLASEEDKISQLAFNLKDSWQMWHINKLGLSPNTLNYYQQFSNAENEFKFVIRS